MVKFPASLMIFAVVGIGFKPDLLVVEGNIDSGRHIQNGDRLSFADALNEKYVQFDCISAHDGPATF
jgi:hypothetical protein